MAEKLNSETGARQTMSTWTKVIDSFETLPPHYKNILETQYTKAEYFPLTLLAPSLFKPQGKTTEKLIMDVGNAIQIVERNNEQVIAKRYPYQSICTIELGSILLSSWLTVDGLTNTGKVDLSTIDFNTSSLRHYEVFLKKLRPASRTYTSDQNKAEKDKFDFLSDLNFKLMNYGRSCLIEGETVNQILYQPEIKKPVFAILGDLFQKLVTPPHLTILTDLELIFIEDIGRGRQAHESHYGGIWQYISLQNIRSAKWTEAEEERLTLAINLSTGRVIEKTFTGSNKPGLEQLCTQIRQLSGGA